MIKPFSTFGMEPTFFPVLKQYPKWWDASGTWDRVAEQISDKIINERIRHPWWKKAEVDEGVLEVPTPPHNDFRKFKRSWKSLHKILEKYEYTNSSDVCLEGQGGCHITFSLDDLPYKKRWASGVFKYKGPALNWYEGNRTIEINTQRHMSYRELFARNLIAFMANNPSLVWSCLAPNDDVSSTIPKFAFAPYAGSNYTMRKGEFLTYRTGDHFYEIGDDHDKSLKRVELRFFMMPRSTEEMTFHFELANKILAYVKNMTDQKRYFEIKKTQKSLKRYSFNKAKRELQEVFRLLDISYSKYVELGKEDLLKSRFHDYGKDYLV